MLVNRWVLPSHLVLPWLSVATGTLLNPLSKNKYVYAINVELLPVAS